MEPRPRGSACRGERRRGPGGRDVALLSAGFNVVLDWDGTVTEEDTLVMVLREFGDPEVFERASSSLDRGEITLNEEVRQQFAAVRAPIAEVVAWLLERVRVRPGFHAFAARFRPLVVTSGFHELIEPVLAREGVRVELVANRIDSRPDGWRVRFQDETDCGTCGQPCKRASLPPRPVVYVGDGYSDRCAALAADRVFARDGLASYLTERGVAFEPFEDFDAVARRLDGAGGALEPATRRRGRKT